MRPQKQKRGRLGRAASERVKAPEQFANPVPTRERLAHQHSLQLNQRLAASQTAKPKSDIEPRLRLGTQSRVKISSWPCRKADNTTGAVRLVVDQRRSSTLPSARVGVGADLHDSTDSGIL